MYCQVLGPRSECTSIQRFQGRGTDVRRDLRQAVASIRCRFSARSCQQQSGHRDQDDRWPARHHQALAQGPKRYVPVVSGRRGGIARITSLETLNEAVLAKLDGLSEYNLRKPSTHRDHRDHRLGELRRQDRDRNTDGLRCSPGRGPPRLEPRQKGSLYGVMPGTTRR